MRLTILSLLLSITSVLLATTHKTETVVYFDRDKIQGELIRVLAEHELNETQITTATNKFKAALDKTLLNYSKKNNVVILNKNWILAGGTDKTQEIKEQLVSLMRGIK